MRIRTSSTLRPRRLVAAAATVATAVSLAVAIPAVAAPHSDRKPPPRPSSGAISAAQVQAALADKNKLAALVGALSGQVAAKQIQLDQLNAKLQYAEQVMALRLSQEQTAKHNAQVAAAALVTANQRAAAKRQEYVQSITAAYYSDDSNLDGAAGALLTASDPNALLTQSALMAYRARAKSEAVAAMQTAQVVQSNAEARARTTQQKAVAASAAAKKSVAAAATLYRSTQQQQAALQTDLQNQQAQAAAAKQAYNSTANARAKYVTYLSDLADYKAYKREQARKRAAAAAAALAAARARANNGGGGGGGSSSGGGGGSSSPAPPSGGSWTAAKGRAAANRALSELGVMYAWAGGNAYGPTRGVCAGDGAWNDCNVIGFDCSGLAMYAWGKMWTHFAATQYWQAGSYHPPVSQLMPGDLLFWSYGSLSDIHHVAIYIGGGRMVEAPESGVPARTASIYEYGNISGTTRPLT